MKKFVFSFMALLFVTMSANAQLIFEGNRLKYGAVPSNFAGNAYNTAFVGNHHYWISSTGAWLRVGFGDNGGVATIGGSGHNISFYGPNSFTTQYPYDFYNNIHIQAAYCYSDARAKTNILNLDNSTSKIMKIRPVSYEFKGKGQDKNRKSNRDIGFLAQELQEIVPEAVVTNEHGEMLINYNAVIPLLVSSVQELNARVAELEKELAEQTSKH